MKQTVGKYIVKCIKNLGVKDLFGVPGDYNLLFLDDIMAEKSLRWVGDTNELNAGYAADAYARIHGISVLLTTGGVGELSAVNAIGGAYAENVPIIHIVGHPSLQAVQDKKFIHHFLSGGPNFGNGHKEIAGKVSESCGVVTRYNAAIEVPRLFQAAYESKKPVTLYLPSNENNQFIDATAHITEYPQSNRKHMQALLKTIHQVLKRAKRPLVLVDVLVNRFSLKSEVRRLLKKLNVPVATTLFGRGAFDETAPQFAGLYMGTNSSAEVKKEVENADAVLIIGGLHDCDYNTGKFTLDFNRAKHLIQLQGNYAVIDGEYLQEIWLPDIVKELERTMPALNKLAVHRPAVHKKVKATNFKASLTQASFWREVEPLIAKQNTIGIYEVGTAIWASVMLRAAKNTEFIGSYGYASIGYATPAVLGTGLADAKRRTIAFIGDGSFQLTAQAIATMLRHKLTPVIFLLNNDGYTIERVIHGPHARYNDVHMWDYTAFAKSMTLNKKQVYTAKVKTLEQLRKELEHLPKDQLVFIEVILGKMDAPKALTDMFENPPKVNLYKNLSE